MSIPAITKRRQIPWRESAKGWLIVFTGFVALLALGELAEMAVGHWFGGSAARGVVHVRDTLLAVWAYGSSVGLIFAGEQLSLRAKIRVGIVAGAGYVLFVLAVMRGILRQPMRPWLSAIILIGGIWALLFFSSIAGIRASTKREGPAVRGKILAGIVLTAGFLLIALAIAPGLLYQPLRPWLTATILIGGIWSVILVLSTVSIRLYRKTSATPHPS